MEIRDPLVNVYAYAFTGRKCIFYDHAKEINYQIHTL